MRRAVLGLAEQQGRLDILVNNAAWVRYQSVADIAPETVDRMLNIGFKAIIWGIQPVPLKELPSGPRPWTPSAAARSSMSRRSPD